MVIINNLSEHMTSKLDHVRFKQSLDVSNPHFSNIIPRFWILICVPISIAYPSFSARIIVDAI
jgi:hypothetical protein